MMYPWIHARTHNMHPYPGDGLEFTYPLGKEDHSFPACLRLAVSNGALDVFSTQPTGIRIA